MSNSDSLLNKGVFDLRAVLAERQLPETEVSFYIDEDMGHALERVEAQLSNLKNTLAVSKLGDDKAAIKQAQTAVKKTEDKLEELRQAVTPYKAHIRTITRRAKFDIQSKAIHKFPFQRDVQGFDDAENEINRTRYADALVWASHLRSIEAPDGATQTFAGFDDLEKVQDIMDTIPESAYRRINKAIDDLMDDGTQFEFAAQNEDFSSES